MQSTAKNANSKKAQNNKRKRNQLTANGFQEKRADNTVSDDEQKREAKKLKSKQCINSVIEPLIQHQVGRPSVKFRNRNHHYAILQLPMQPNVIDKDSLLSHFQTKSPFTAAHSMPLHTTPGLGPSTPDLMVRTLHTKHTYQQDLARLENKYKNNSGPIESDGGMHVQHTVALVYAALLDRDPDPYMQLSTGYDYHYTGGTLVAIQNNSNGSDGCIATIFKAIGASLENMEVLQIGVSAQDDFHCDGDLKVREAEICPVGAIGPILEIVPNEDGTVVLVRKRNVIIVLREVNVSQDVKEWRAVQKIFSTNPFASICFVTRPSAPCETLTLCTTDYEQELQLWIVSDDEASCEDMVKLPSATSAAGTRLTHHSSDNWSAVRSVDGDSLVACLDRRAIHFYTVLQNESLSSDSEADTYQLVHRGGNDFSSWTMNCEKCCALETTPSEGLLFVATCHKLIVGRIEKKGTQLLEKSERSDHSFVAGEETIELKVLLVFAHNLKQRPVFISHQWEPATNDKEDEHHFVLFGSHLPMSYGVANFTRSGSSTPVYAARHYAYHPPTFHDTYRVAQTRGCCLSAYEPLKKRFYACQSGAVLIRGVTRDDEEDPRMHILLQTSAGDVLQQRLSYNFERAEEKIDRASVEQQKQTMAQILQHWHDTLVKQAGKIPYSATSFRTMQKFRDIFNCPLGGNDLKEVLFLPPKIKRIRKKVSRTADSNSDCDGEESQDESRDDEGQLSTTQDDTSDLSVIMRRYVKERRQRYGNKPPIPWKQTTEELQQYRDALAPSMLAVWGIANSAAPGHSTNAGRIPTQLPPLVDINERVGNWVNDMSSERRELETVLEEDDTIVDLNSVSMDAMPRTDEYNSEDLLTQPWTMSPTFTAAPLSQQLEQTKKTNVRPPRRPYSQGF
uniref:Uncharacterized protein n=1 Tax=Anopheles funestus TaxID=62324 RepID=A0A182RXJ1_ANOFN